MNLRSAKEIFKYPSAVAGIVIIAALIGVSIYTLITIPYSTAIRLWRGSEADWYTNPRNAAPTWYNWFSKEKLPESVVLNDNSSEEHVLKTVEEKAKSKNINYTFTFDFEADSFPDDITVYFNTQYATKAPFVGLTWVTPDGTETRLGNFTLANHFVYRIAQDDKVTRKLGGNKAQIGLFSDLANKEYTKPVKGTYKLLVEGVTFDTQSDISAELVVYGKLAGWAGTDHLRRDIGLALLWGTPVALLFGLLAAVGTSLAQLIIAGVGTWYGGWLDGLIQRITEINLVLPFLPILIMVGTFYSRSLFTLLTVTILLSIFGSGIKSYRAIFLQVKESPYIEAARSYGASNMRIIFSYMIPRLIPMLIPQFIVQVPSYVFLEASLAVLGLGDPTLPTWGKLIDDSRSNGALYQGWYYWVLEPSFLLMLTGLAFTIVGYAMDRVFNPRLRGE